MLNNLIRSKRIKLSSFKDAHLKNMMNFMIKSKNQKNKFGFLFNNNNKHSKKNYKLSKKTKIT